MENNTNTIENLLSQVSSIIANTEGTATKSGINFNIISILNMEYNERYTHSAIIADLLNPKGKHGQGNLFLELFIKHCEIKFEKFEVNNVDVITEEYVGELLNTRTFIDITIKDNDSGSCILIENKINAGNQPNQLERYKMVNHDSLIYLTLNGSEYETKVTNFNYIRISYNKHIIKWLEECIKSVKPELDKIALTIEMYLDTVKKITNQSIYKTMEMDIKKSILQSAESLEAARKIQENYSQLKQSISEEFWKLLDEKLGQKGFKREGNINNFYYSIEFDKEENQMFLGITIKPKQVREDHLEIHKMIKGLITSIEPNNGSTPYWPIWYLPNENSLLSKSIIDNLNSENLINFYNKLNEEVDIIVEHYAKILSTLENNIESK